MASRLFPRIVPGHTHGILLYGLTWRPDGLRRVHLYTLTASSSLASHAILT